MKTTLCSIVIIIVIYLSLVPNSYSQNWTSLGGGIDGTVNELTVYGTKLIAGGEFLQAGGVNANNIAMWNGSFWEPLGNGIDGAVNALTVYNNRLIAGGDFTFASGVRVNNIASWDGNSWTALDSGLDGTVYALTVFQNQLIAGGALYILEDTIFSSVAKWNGSVWSPVSNNSTGAGGTVEALTLFNSSLIIGGSWLQGGIPNGSFLVIAWDGNNFTPLMNDLNHDMFVFALTVYGGQLIAGGNIDYANGILVNNVARWNGSNWAALSTGTDDIVRSLNVYGNEMIAGGDFTTAGGFNVNSIARWTGNSWASLSTGMDYSVYALTVYNSKLIAGGNFTTAGGFNIPGIACWAGNIGVKNIGSNIPDRFELFQNYPNPFNPNTNIRYSLPMNSFVKLVVFDMLGKEIETLVNKNQSAGTYEASFNSSQYPSGVYFYRLTTEGFSGTKRMLLVK